MGLPNPGVGVTSGPQYASDIYNCMTIIDGHTHTSGSGVPITTAAININANLSFNSFSAYNLNALTLNVLSGSAPNQSLYVTGVDLYYIDGNGNQIKITAGGTVNATSNGISSGAASASFVGGTLVVKSSSTVAANIDVASVILRNPTSNSFGLTLAPPALGSNYGLVLPLIPAQTNVMTLDTSGNMGSTTWNVVAEGVSRSTGTSVGLLGVAISTTIATSYSSTAVSSALGSCTLITSGRPVMVILMASSPQAYVGMSGTTTNNGGTVYFYRNGSEVCDQRLSGNATGITQSTSIQVPPSSFQFIDTPTSGTYTYDVRLAVDVGTSSTISLEQLSIAAYEL